MGRAIVRDADAFLFDEPLSNLDAKLRGQMRTEILRMQRRLGTTTVYVTHDQTEAMTLGDRVAVLRKGVLQQVATPRELYEQPVNMFVAGFIGSPPMNFVPGTVEDGKLSLPFVVVRAARRVRAAVGDREYVIVGIRPEAFEDAALIEAGKQRPGRHVRGQGRRHRVAGQRAVRLHPLRRARITWWPASPSSSGNWTASGMRSQLVVALDPTSRIRDNSEATLWFDPRDMHIFDPQTGDNLTLSIEG